MRGFRQPLTIGESEGNSLDKRTWILADGREVFGTKFAVVTQGKPIPDLRGMFLRGIPAGSPRPAGDVQESATALPKTTPFSGVTSAGGAIAPDQLPRSALQSAVDKYNAGGSNYWVIVSGPAKPVEAHTHTVSIAGGDEETRPKNVGIFYYIKIN
jgi:hypothetical protein